MSVRAGTRLALRAYPPSFRRRYGGELSALVDDLGASASAGDLWRGAARAWLRPSLTGTDAPRQRVQASLATTWVAWCAGFLVAPATNRALLDPPLAGTDATVRGLLDAGTILFGLGWALALLGALPIVVRSVLPALRTPGRTALRPLLAPLLLSALVGAGLVTLVLLRHVHRLTGAHPSGGLLVVGAVWLAGFLAFVISLGLAPAAALGRLAPAAITMRLPALLLGPLALVLTASFAVSLSAVLGARGASLLGSPVPLVGVLVVAGAAALVACVSAARGLAAR